MNKKVGVGVFCFLIVSMLLINVGFVSAGLIEDLGKGFKAVADLVTSITTNFLKPIAELLLSTENLTPELLFAKVLFFIIVLGVVHFALKQVKFFEDQNAFLYGLIIFAVSILATRFLATADLINTIILPYSVVGVAISAGLPFVIFFLVINKGFRGVEYSALRKVAWAFFAVVFIGLYYTREPTISSNIKYIYFATILASILMLLFDGTMQRFWDDMKIKRSKAHRLQEFINDLNDKISKAQDSLMTGTPHDVVQDMIKEYEEMKQGAIKRFKKNKNI
ncbi:MAG: hypothetical protein V1829_02665 [bacterium]